MDYNTEFYTVQAMKHFGGSFVQHLATAYSVADAENSRRLREAFPEIFQRYGPGSTYYELAGGKKEV